MASNTDYLPDEITYGFVADRVLLAIGDTTSDDNRYPDGVPAQGTVRFSPERTILYTQQRPATVLPQDIECTIYHRDHPVAKEQGYEPELVGKLVDPAGRVGNVALIVGWYDVVYRLSTGTAQRFRFQVLPEHTAENPLWLPEVAPLQPTPSERFVVNEQVYNDTKTARDQAEGYRNEAGQSATSAAEILSDVQDLGIRVDTSVGTRVFVGDIMVFGEIPPRILPVNGLVEGQLRISRDNNSITVALVDAVFETSGNKSMPRLEATYRPAGTLLVRTPWFTNDGRTGLATLTGGGYFNILDVPANTTINLNFSFPTSYSWAAIEPGTPA